MKEKHVTFTSIRENIFSRLVVPLVINILGLLSEIAFDITALTYFLSILYGLSSKISNYSLLCYAYIAMFGVVFQYYLAFQCFMLRFMSYSGRPRIINVSLYTVYLHHQTSTCL